jgi:hypothetical protein
MTKIKSVTGTYTELIKITGMPESFCAPCKENEDLTTINKDIPRGAYVGVRPKKDMADVWHGSTVSHAYTQGNMNGSVFLTHWKEYILQSEDFIKKGRLDDDRLKALGDQGAASTPLAFSYFDQNNVPCGVSVCYSQSDPSLWTATIISNTTAEPDQRTVTMICAEEMLGSSVPTVWNSTAMKQFRKALNSQTVSELLGNLIDPNGNADVTHLNQLKKRILAGKNIDNRDEKEKLILSLSAYLQEVNPKNPKLNALMTKFIKEWSTDADFFEERYFNDLLSEIQSAFISELKTCNLSEEDRNYEAFKASLFFTELKLENAVSACNAWEAQAILEAKSTLSEMRLKPQRPPLPYPEITYEAQKNQACAVRAPNLELQAELDKLKNFVSQMHPSDGYEQERVSQFQAFFEAMKEATRGGADVHGAQKVQAFSQLLRDVIAVNNERPDREASARLKQVFKNENPLLSPTDLERLKFLTLPNTKVNTSMREYFEKMKALESALNQISEGTPFYDAAKQLAKVTQAIMHEQFARLTEADFKQVNNFLEACIQGVASGEAPGLEGLVPTFLEVKKLGDHGTGSLGVQGVIGEFSKALAAQSVEKLSSSPGSDSSLS